MPTTPPDTPGPPETPWLRDHHSTDIDEYAAAQAGWALRYEQLSPGRFAGEFCHVQLPGVRLVRESASRQVRQTGQIGTDTVGFALAATLPGEAFFHGQALDADTLMVGPGDDLDMTTPDGYEHFGIVVDRGLLAELWAGLYQKPWSPWLDLQLVVRARPGMAGHVRGLHRQVLDTLAASPALLEEPRAVLHLRDALLIEWIEAIPSRVDTSALEGIEARRRLVARACEWVLDRRDDPPTILRVCTEIGSSPRKLDHCFRDVLGISPSRYLRAVRLNGARRELKGRMSRHGDDTVHDIAARWGFWHMGAFSADYKRQFGECPSATVERRRA
jgi:AraC family transcriptional regulator, ethanolamine operon transcriptional activator